MKEFLLTKRKIRIERESIRVFAPATLANLNCGFDVLGLCLDNPGDIVEIRITPNPIIKIVSIQGDEGKLPFEVEKNTVSVSILKMLEFIEGFEGGLEIELFKGMPIGSGLGSSAASTVAGVYAVNELFGRPFTVEELLQFCMYGEKVACGSAHADNVAPALLGGLVLIKSYNPLQVLSLPTPKDLFISIIYPHVEIKTQDARNQLRIDISLKEGVAYWGNLAGFIASLYTQDKLLMKNSLQDNLIEPQRSSNIPGFEELKEAALNHQVLGFGISGSGPSLFTLSEDVQTIKNLEVIYQDILKSKGIESSLFSCKINTEGPKKL